MDGSGQDGAIAVSIRGVSKRFGTVAALAEADLDIRRGEFFSLLGPSGCGKTTLLRIIGGFESPSGGEVLIGGRSVLDQPPYRRRTNMVFQHGALFPHLTVAENIAFGLEMKRADRATIARRVEEALALVRLPGYGARRIGQLSGGQRQRVAVARALVNDPEVLLLDEPLGALDLQLRLQLQEELRRIHRATGSTFVFVTHDQGEAISLSDRLAVMSGGRILQVGTPREVYERPQTRFVAEFMGHSNFLPGRVLSAGAVEAAGLRFPSRLPQGAAPGKAVTVALRYEKLEVLPDGTPGTAAAQLEDETYMGATLRRRVILPDGTMLVSDAANTGGAAAMAPGDAVGLRWAADSATILRD
jgi:ABC-type Fe3+/spermidine/putrescine transport system ATPase subunit